MKIALHLFYCLWLSLAFAASAQVRYNVVPLVPSDLNLGNAFGGAVNELGDATGVFLGPLQENHGFVYTDQGGFSELHGAGDSLFPTGINTGRQIAAYGGPFGVIRLLRYTPGVGFLDLGTFGGRENETHAINNRGQVVGFSSTTQGKEHAFRYTDGVGLQDLGTLPGAVHSDARGINDLAWVTGTSGNRAFLYTDELGMVDIGPGSGWAINAAGVIVGQDSFRPVLYTDAQAIPLVGNVGRANAINNHNVVVGTIDVFGFTRAFIWSEGEGAQDLNSLIDPNTGWYLAGAGGINDSGQIVGVGFSAERPDLFTPFRLDPIRTPTEALARCIKLVEDSILSRNNKQPLLATLNAAAASIERGDYPSAIGQLGAFQNKVRAQIFRDDPAQANALIKCAQDVLTAIERATAPPPPRPNTTLPPAHYQRLLQQRGLLLHEPPGHDLLRPFFPMR